MVQFLPTGHASWRSGKVAAGIYCNKEALFLALTLKDRARLAGASQERPFEVASSRVSFQVGGSQSVSVNRRRLMAFSGNVH